MNWDLGDHRHEWTHWLKSRLRERNVQQKEVASDIAIREGVRGSRTTTVSDFINGDPDTLRQWFQVHAKRIDILCEKLEISPGELKAYLDQLLGGPPPGPAWHDEFPEYTLDDAEITSPLVSELGGCPGSVAAAWVARWKADRKSEFRTLFVIGRAGQARDIAAAQILAAARKETDPEPVLLVADQTPDDGRSLVIQLVEEQQERPALTAQLSPWGPAQLLTLTRRLIGLPRFPADQRRALECFAGLLEHDASADTLQLGPDLAIRLLACVARQGCPSHPSGIRTLLTQSIWERASRGNGTLAALGETLMERFYAALARRGRPTAPGCAFWTETTVDAVTVVRSTLRDLAGATGMDHLELLDAVEAASSSKARREALSTLRMAISADLAPRIVQDLVNGGILVEETAGGTPMVRPAHPALAVTWAARGLGGQVAFGPHGAAVCDPEWGRLIGEQARLGLAWPELDRCLDGLPPELSVDRALVTLQFALGTPKEMAASAMIPAWATVLWAVALGFLDPHWPASPWGWCGRARGILQQVTHRYRFTLPRMKVEPIPKIRAMVPETARRMIEGWRAPQEGDRERPPEWIEEWFPLSVTGGPTSDRLTRVLIDLASDCFVIDRVELASAWGRFDPPRRVARILEEAERGDPGCLAVVSGSALTETQDRAVQQRAYDLWRELPWSTRVDAARRGMGLGADGPRIFWKLATEGDPSDPRLVEIAKKLGSEAMEPSCRRVLCGHGSVASTGEVHLALAIAEALDLRALLHDLVEEPFRLAAAAKVGTSDGLLEVNGVLGFDQGEGEWDVRSTVEQPVLKADAIAFQAGQALYRLGERAPLHRRWREGGPELNEAAMLACRRIQGLLDLAALPPSEWQELGIPEDVLAACFRPDVPESRLRSLLPTTRRITGLSAALGLGLANVATERLTAVLGLEALLFELPASLPPELDRALMQVPRLRRRGVLRAAPPLPRRQQAARALIELEDDEPIRVWLESREQDGHGSPAILAARDAVEGLIKEAPEILDRCWRVLTRLGGDDDRMARRAEDLLHRGSARGTRVDPAFPRPFVIEYAMGTNDPKQLLVYSLANKHRANWLPVLRRAHGKAKDTRARAWWALQIATLQADPPELTDALLDWLAEPDPWVGGELWHLDGSTWLGGIREMLKAALTLSDASVPAGLVQLFRSALYLEIGPGEHSREAPDRMSLSEGWGAAPWPIADLAQALINRGRTQVVLDAWRSPPVPGAAGRIRSWLRPFWSLHAPTEELAAHLWSPTGFELEAAQELVRRGHLDLREDALRAGAELHVPAWSLVAEVTPKDLPDVLNLRLDRGMPWRVATWTYTRAAESAGATEAVTAARREVFRRTVPDERE